MARIAIVARNVLVEFEGTVCLHRGETRLLDGLLSRGNEVVYLAPLVRSSNPLHSSFPGHDPLPEHHNLHLVPLPAYERVDLRLIDKLRNWFASGRQLRSSLRGCDGLIVFMPSPQGLVGLLVGRWLRMPSVVYYGGDWSAELSMQAPEGSLLARLSLRLRREVRRSLQELSYRLSPALLVRDPALYQRLSRRRTRVQLAGPFVSLSVPDMCSRSDTCQGPELLALSAGGLVYHKGILEILRAVRLVRDAGCAIEWWHAGEIWPDFLKSVQQEVRNLDLADKVRFLGYLEPTELVRVYRQADVLLHGAHAEGMPRVLAEAMSQGLPVIATRVGGVALALEHERHALLVEPGSAPAMAEAILRLRSDPVLRQTLIEQGRQWAIEELSRDPVEQILSALPPEC